eukprot:5576867-Amphidinium_carterae.4
MEAADDYFDWWPTLNLAGASISEDEARATGLTLLRRSQTWLQGGEPALKIKDYANFSEGKTLADYETWCGTDVLMALLEPVLLTEESTWRTGYPLIKYRTANSRNPAARRCSWRMGARKTLGAL